MKMSVPVEMPVNVIKSYSDTAGAFHVVGYACTNDLDRVNDVVSDEAMADAAKDLEGPSSTVLFNHDDNCPIGRVFKQLVDKKGILIDAIVDQSAVIPATGTPMVDAIKQGILNKFSIRFRILNAVKEFVAEYGKVVNVIKRMMLVEASLVSIPANPAAEAMNWYMSKALNQGENRMSTKIQKSMVDDALATCEELIKNPDAGVSAAGKKLKALMESMTAQATAMEGEAEKAVTESAAAKLAAEAAAKEAADAAKNVVKANEELVEAKALSTKTTGELQAMEAKLTVLKGEADTAKSLAETKEKERAELATKVETTQKSLTGLQAEVVTLKTQLEVAQKPGRKGLNVDRSAPKVLEAQKSLDNTLQGQSPNDQLRTLLGAEAALR